MTKIMIFGFFLSACASPSPEFFGAESRTVDLEGDRITVFYTSNKAQAIRTNLRRKPVQLEAVSRLVQAVELVTGCKIKPKSLRGDVVVINVLLDCV